MVKNKPFSEIKAESPEGAVCSNCTTLKPWTEYVSYDYSVSRGRDKCISCLLEIGEAYRNANPDGKVCTKCDTLKGWDEFNLSKVNKDGRVSNCKSCLYNRHNPASQLKFRTDNPDGKECNRCEVVKGWDMFSPDKQTYDGRRTLCLSCVASRYSEKDQKKYRKDNPDGKNCSRCSTFKPYSEFNLDKATRSGLDAECANCTSERKAKYYKENSQLVKDRVRSYQIKNPEKRAAHLNLQAAIISPNVALIKPKACEHCSSEDKSLQGHHWSYEDEHHLDVIWLCTGCHRKEHNRLSNNLLNEHVIDCSKQKSITLTDPSITSIRLTNVDTSILTNLTLSSLTLLKDFSWLKELSTLTSLKVFNLPYYDDTVELNNLTLRVTLNKCPSVIDVTKLLNGKRKLTCVNLTHLDIIKDDNLKVLHTYEP